MTGKVVALLQVPNRRLFKLGPAAEYLGISTDSLVKYSEMGQIAAYNLNGVRVFRLEDLDRLIDELPRWDDPGGEKPAKVVERMAHL